MTPTTFLNNILPSWNNILPMMEINFIWLGRMVRDEMFFFPPSVDWLGLLDCDGTRGSGDAFKVASLTVPFSREFLTSIPRRNSRLYARAYRTLNFFL